MDNLLLFAIAGVFGVMFVTIGNLKKQLQQKELDSRIDGIYEEFSNVRQTIDKEVENISRAIDTVQNEIYEVRDNVVRDITERLQTFSHVTNEMDRRLDVIENSNNKEREPSLYDKVSIP